MLPAVCEPSEPAIFVFLQDDGVAMRKRAGHPAAQPKLAVLSLPDRFVELPDLVDQRTPEQSAAGGGDRPSTRSSPWRQPEARLPPTSTRGGGRARAASEQDVAVYDARVVLSAVVASSSRACGSNSSS